MAQARIRPGANEGMTGANRNRRAPICAKVRTRPDRQRHSTGRYTDPNPNPGLRIREKSSLKGAEMRPPFEEENERDDHRR